MNLRTLSTAMLATMAAVLWMGAPNASATAITAAEGEVFTGTIKAEAEGPLVIEGTINVSCSKSSFEGTVESHGPEVPAVVKLGSLTFSECGTSTVTVVKSGTLELNATEEGEGDGTVTSSGAEITVLTHSLFLGTRHCIYVTNETELGTLTDSYTLETEATVDIGSASLPQSATDALCGGEDKLTGSYKITSPTELGVHEAFKNFHFGIEDSSATLESSQDQKSAQTFTFDLGAITCTALSGGIGWPDKVNKSSTFIMIGNPKYTGCTVASNGCNIFLLSGSLTGGVYEGTVSISCGPKPKPIEVSGINCKVTIPPQRYGLKQGLSEVKYKTIGAGASREITAELNVSGITYIEDGAGCKNNGKVKINGKYTGNVNIKANKGGQKGLYLT